jgi:biotin carboxyl carrier protein
VRVDAGVADGSVVAVHYDPLLAKVIAHAPTRPEATRLLASTLAAARLHGIVTNRDLLVGVLRSEAFLSWETDTAFLDRHPPAELTAAGGSASPLTDRLHAAAVVLAAQAERRATAVVYPAVPSGWRNNPSQLQRVDLQLAPGSGSDPGPRVSVGYRFDRTGTLESLEVDGAPLPGSRLWSCTPDPAHPPGRTAAQATSTWLLDLEVEGVRRRYEAHRVGTTWFVDSSLGHSQFHEPAPLPDGSVAGAGLSAAGGWGSGASPSGSGAARSASGAPPSASGAPPAPGSQLEGLWTADRPDSGDRVRSPTGGPGTEGRGSGTPPAGGATVSPQPGIVRRVEVRVGDRVEVGAVLVVVEAMKTEHLIAATRAGTVRQVLVAEGQEIAAEAMVVEMEEPADG